MTCSTDKIQTVVDFVRDVKPFHTKIYEVQLTYEFNEPVNMQVDDTHYIDGLIEFDYDSEIVEVNAGWDTNAWDELWKYGTKVRQPIIEINPTDKYISFIGDVTYSFSLDAYAKGVSPVNVSSFDPITGTFELTRTVPWTTGYPVDVECSMLYPAPLVAGVVYYAIVDSPTKIRLALSRAQALAGIDINYQSYSAGPITIRALQHPVVIQPSNQTIYVTSAQYDFPTNRTRIYLSDQSFVGLEYGLVDILIESNWDNPDVSSGGLSASYTTVLTTIDENISFEYADFRYHDLVGVGPAPAVDQLEPWGGDNGERVVLPQAIERNLGKFIIAGDWRFFASTELSSSTTGTFFIQSHNQPDLIIEIASHFYVEPVGDIPGYTEFTLVGAMPAEFAMTTRLILFTNDQFAQPISTVNAYWDRVWDMYPAADENTAETMISETIQIFVDQGAVPIGAAYWDGNRWDYSGFDQEII